MGGSKKLTEEQIVEIYALRRRGLSRREIGARFGISDVTVWNIINGHSWKNVFRKHHAGAT